MALDNSLFASQDVEAHDIELGDGSKHKLYFKEATAGAFSDYSAALRSDDVKERAKAPAIIIAACLCEPDGSAAITREKVMELKIDPMNRIFMKCLEVSTKKKESDAEQKNSSGTS